MSEELDEVMEEEEIDEIEEEEVEEEEVVEKDKKDYAIINLKKKEKEYKKIIAEYEAKEKELQLQKELKAKQQRYEEDGYSVEEAQAKASQDNLQSQMQRDIQMLKYQNKVQLLSNEYEDVEENFDEIMDYVNKGIPFDKACKALLTKKDDFDVRTSAEAEAVQRRRKAESTTTPIAERTKVKGNTAYKSYTAEAKSLGLKPLTKEQYAELQKFKE